MRDHMQELRAAWRAEPNPPTATQRLELFSRFHIRYHLARPEAVFIAYMELRNLEPANFAAVQILRHAYEDELELILSAGQASSNFRVPDSRLATMAIIAMLTGVTAWYQEGGRLSRDRVERIYWNMVRRLVGA